MFTPWFSQEGMETIRAEPVADVVSKVLSQASCNTFSLKNAGIRYRGPVAIFTRIVSIASCENEGVNIRKRT